MQVLIAADEALKRLEVDNVERNAILDAFRYIDQQRTADDSILGLRASDQEQAARSPEPIDSRPLARCCLILASH